MIKRAYTKPVYIKNVKIGARAPITVQSMLNTHAHDIEKSIEQAKQLQIAGCEILRVAIPDEKSIALIPELKKAVDMPIVADIHFDYKLALGAIDAGADKIRINPGNIGGHDRVGAVATACKEKDIPIRIGVNSGSLEKEILQKYGSPNPQALRDSALYHASLLEQFDFTNIILSVKSSDVPTTVEAYKLVHRALAKRPKDYRYPLHLGITEAGTKHMGMLKSAAGIGALLLDGIGDTIRVSLTDHPASEIQIAIDLLRALGIRKDGYNVISCPTCGRTEIDLIGMVDQVEKQMKKLEDKGVFDSIEGFTVAVMGCVVNGPGEAKQADVGLAGGKGKVVIFKKGEIIKTVDQKHAVDQLMQEVISIINQYKQDR